ncbi:MAG: hypothetical protein ACXVEU_20335 [Nocardioidaceae bacterium]
MERLLLARLLAVVGVLGWAVAFFGVVDLLTVLLQDRAFAPFYVLETGWGLVFAVLVGGPLAVLVVRPRTVAALWQLLVVGAAILVAGGVERAPRQILVGALVASTALAVAGAAGTPLRTRHRQPDPLLALMAALAAAAALGYGVELIRYTGPDDDTWGLLHVPMQMALLVAVPAVAALAAWTGSRVAVWTVAVSAVWIGVESVVYPDLVGSLGALGGTVAAGWGVSLVLFAEAARTRGG